MQSSTSQDSRQRERQRLLEEVASWCHPAGMLGTTTFDELSSLRGESPIAHDYVAAILRSKFTLRSKSCAARVKVQPAEQFIKVQAAELEKLGRAEHMVIEFHFDETEDSAGTTFSQSVL